MKRMRGSNFSKEEELLLARTVATGIYKNTIECKMTDKCNNQEKNEAWKKVTEHVNANCTKTRTLDQLKMKYENLKAKARKMVALQMSCMTGTGGGPAQIPESDPVLETVISLINKKTVVGLHSPWDSDNQITQDLPNEVEGMAVPKGIVPSNPLETVPSQEAGEGIAIYENFSNMVYITKRKREEEQEAVDPEENLPSKTWETYTPRKLKTPMSKKLRFRQSAKESFYEKKIAFAEEEIKKSKLEQEDLLLRRRQDAERLDMEKKEHLKKMELLDIQIELKRRMLDN
nr:unnamed protein product [Callosobruchus chinensis]